MISATMIDAGALNERSPAELSAYLRSHGWHLSQRNGTSAVWILPIDSDEFEILQPLDPGLRDYAARVRDALRVLAVAERRPEQEILQSITDAGMDVHTVRLFPADQPPGLIGIEDGVLAYESLRLLVSAAAYTVFSDQHRVVQPSRKPQGLTDYLRNVRIGPGAQGSYVLSLHTPVPPRLSTDQPSVLAELGVELPEPEPVERQVSIRMYESVHAALEAADAALVDVDGLEYFTGAVGRGVSANLCEALAGLGGWSQNPFEISVAFAASWPAPGPLPPVRFRRDHLPILRQAAAELRARTSEDDVLVAGSVVRLHREVNSAGEITVVGRVDDQDVERRVWMDLPDDDYESAMRAHEHMVDVSVRGNLIRRGNRLYLSHAREFRLMPDVDSR